MEICYYSKHYIMHINVFIGTEKTVREILKFLTALNNVLQASTRKNESLIT